VAEKRIRRTFSPAFKARAVCELLKGDRTVAQVASDLNVHPNLLTKWKQTAMEKMPSLFTDDQQHAVADLKADYEDQIQDLYAEIGRLTTQLSWVKKKCGLDGGEGDPPVVGRRRSGALPHRAGGAGGD